MAFHENLIKLRKSANLSQEQLADMLNVTRQAVSKWESGQSIPDAEKLLQLSDFFEVPVDQLLRTLRPVKQTDPGDGRFYTVLMFVALAILWFTGLILVVINLFFNFTGVFQSYIWNYSLWMMLLAFLGFAGMLTAHFVRKFRERKE